MPSAMAAPGLRDSTALTPHAADLVAYEGGIGSNEDGVTGDANMPVNDDARIGLLQDDYLPDVLGSEPRMAMLDAKARAAPNRGRTIPGIPGNSPAGSLAWMTITGTVAGRPRTPVPR